MICHRSLGRSLEMQEQAARLVPEAQLRLAVIANRPTSAPPAPIQLRTAALEEPRCDRSVYVSRQDPLLRTGPELSCRMILSSAIQLLTPAALDLFTQPEDLPLILAPRTRTRPLLVTTGSRHPAAGSTRVGLWTPPWMMGSEINCISSLAASV